MNISKRKFGVAAAVALVALACVPVLAMTGCSCSSQDAGNAPAKSVSDKKADKGETSQFTEKSNMTETRDAEGNRVITKKMSDGTERTIVISKDYTKGSGVSSSTDTRIDTGSGSGEGTGTQGAQNEGAGGSGGDIGTGGSGGEQANVPGGGTTTLEQFAALSAEDQYEIFLTFESPRAFLNWYNEILAEYQAENPTIEIEQGDVIHF